MTSTQWDIGHTFWVARCYKFTEERKKMEYGETWSCHRTHYKAVAKQKTITQISIDKYGVVYRGTDAEYVKNGGGFSQILKETEIDKFGTEAEALEFAKTYEGKAKEYFGE